MLRQKTGCSGAGAVSLPLIVESGLVDVVWMEHTYRLMKLKEGSVFLAV